MSAWIADLGTAYSSYSASWMSHNSLFEMNRAVRCLRLFTQCCPEWTPKHQQLFSESGKSMASDSLLSKDTLWSLFLTLMHRPAQAGHSDKVEIKPVFRESVVSTAGFPKAPRKPPPLEREIIWSEEAFWDLAMSVIKFGCFPVSILASASRVPTIYIPVRAWAWLWYVPINSPCRENEERFYVTHWKKRWTQVAWLLTISTRPQELVQHSVASYHFSHWEHRPSNCIGAVVIFVSPEMGEPLPQGGQETIKWDWCSAGTNMRGLHLLTGWIGSGDESQQESMQQMNFPRSGVRACLQVWKTLW